MDDGRSTELMGTATVGDTTYEWLATAIGPALCATRASGTRETLLTGDGVPQAFARLAATTANEPLHLLSREERIVEEAAARALAHQQLLQEVAERRELNDLLDHGTIDLEEYLTRLEPQLTRQAAEQDSIAARLGQLRTFKDLWRQLGGHHLRSTPGDPNATEPPGPTDNERTPGTDETARLRLEDLWHHGRPAAHDTGTPPWHSRPHGSLPDAHLAQEIAWLGRATARTRERARGSKERAKALPAQAAIGEGPNAVRLRSRFETVGRAWECHRRADELFAQQREQTEKARALRQLAARAQRRARSHPVRLLLNATTPGHQQTAAERLREAADRAAGAASRAGTDAAALLAEARNLWPGDPRSDLAYLRSQFPDLHNGAVQGDIASAAREATWLLAEAARLQDVAADYDSTLGALLEERHTRAVLSPQQQAQEERQRAAVHPRTRQGAGSLLNLAHRPQTSQPGRSAGPPTV
ncbi:hypothetical protein ABTY61_37510 [Kitasatospora sp. NPDC096128]|uniref:hypothetical protein n=1 Tax=Kitasatospora sp. NPDC096128 TaxID=3155547 RepID=UPI00331E89E4